MFFRWADSSFCQGGASADSSRMERTASIRIASFAEYACESTPNFPPLYQPSKRIIRTQRLTRSLMSLRSTILADWNAIFPQSVRPHPDGPVGYAPLGAVAP